MPGAPFLGILLRPSSSTKVSVYFDAGWAGDASDRWSHGGYLVSYGENLVSWQSKKQATVAHSSTEAEYKNLADATSKAIWVVKLLQELGIPCSSPIIVWCDNASAISLTANLVLHSTTKHVVASYHFVREKVSDGSLQVKYVSSKEQTADILTKSLPRDTFNYLN